MVFVFVVYLIIFVLGVINMDVWIFVLLNLFNIFVRKLKLILVFYFELEVIWEGLFGIKVIWWGFIFNIKLINLGEGYFLILNLVWSNGCKLYIFEWWIWCLFGWGWIVILLVLKFL